MQNRNNATSTRALLEMLPDNVRALQPTDPTAELDTALCNPLSDTEATAAGAGNALFIIPRALTLHKETGY